MHGNIKFTLCTLDAQGLGGKLHTRFVHLGNKTDGEYFVNDIIPKVIEYLNSNLDIKDLNYGYVLLAQDGRKLTKANKTTILGFGH